ncbi:MAG: hypothetical protein COB78_06840 [Hyphomicrobiales bacterium]|nr:MAG: hypothetical protein COB78_06840 [Hyphomicrobiales bacterium]
MKSVFTSSFLVFALLTFPANAGLAGKGGVKEIHNNGLIRGHQSYKVICKTKGDRVVVRKENRWTDSLGYGFSITFSKMNIQQFAYDLCYGQ